MAHSAEARVRLQTLRDVRLPALEDMFSPSAYTLLAQAVAPAGGVVTSGRPVQVHWRVGRSLTVVYAAGVSWQGAPTEDEYLVAEAQRNRASVRVWRLADDPRLPGLAGILDPVRARLLLDSLDVPGGEVTAGLRAYRPGRRAVVELRAGGVRLFAKVIRPEAAAALQERHKAIGRVLPVPRSHGWSAEHGVVIQQALPGRTLRDALDDRAEMLPPSPMLAEVLARLPAIGDGLQATEPLSAVTGHVRLLARLLPDQASRLEALRSCLEGDVCTDDIVPVHGDFYEAQLMVQDGGVSGLLDLDTVGLGRRVDDWATMVGHLAVRAEEATLERHMRIAAYGRQVLALAETQVDRSALRPRVAAVVLSLATGPFRVQSPSWPEDVRRRIGLAERWLGTPGQPGSAKKTVISALAAPYSGKAG